MNQALSHALHVKGRLRQAGLLDTLGRGGFRSGLSRRRIQAGREQIHCADVEIGDRDRARLSQGGRLRSHEDRERHPLACVGAEARTRRDNDPCKRAGLVDHAREGQSDSVRGGDDGRGEGHGERRVDRHRRLPGQLRAERLRAGHDQRFSSVGKADRRMRPLLRGEVRRGDRR